MLFRKYRDVLEFAELVRSDLMHRPYPDGYIVSKRWQEFLRLAMRKAEGIRSAKDLALLGMELGFDVGPEVISSDERVQFLTSRQQAFIARHPELSSIGESDIARQTTTVQSNGVRYSGMLDQAFTYYEDIKAGIGDLSGIKTILEVGSGYGRLARIMHLLDTSRRYILVDLPEALLLAYAFLRVSFPQAKIALFNGVEATERCDFLLCPIQGLHALRLRPDLLVNTYSFAEMTQGCVDYLMSKIANLQPRFLYSLNLVFCDKSLHYDTGGRDGEGNDTILVLRPEWWPERFVLIPSFYEGLPRITGSIVLRHISMRVDELCERLRKRGDIGSLYLAALWSGDQATVHRFMEALKIAYSQFGFRHPLEPIGEVKVLRHLAT